ncbi:MAG: glycosyltransferase [Bacteroidales bacterium]|nr:glycosyltransferase [Bacteroidales bacterium]
MEKIVVFGPGPVFKGGIANYNTSLAKAFDRMDNVEVHIVSWTQQYPAIIPRDFIDRSSKANQLEGTNIKVHYITNYNNPFSWKRTVQLIKDINPRMAVFQWAISVQGIPMGFIAKKLRKTSKIEVVFDMHFVKQKEGSKIDDRLTRIGVRHANTYVAHSYKTVLELQDLFPKEKFEIIDKGCSCIECGKSVIKLYHPVYDMFEPDPAFDVEAMKKQLNLRKYVFLFFGFIRKYKGLHNCIEAFAKLAQKRDDVTLLVVGESFWSTLDKKKFGTKIKNFFFGIAKSLFLSNKEDEKNYRPLELIEKYGIHDQVTLVNEFVANEDVHKYFQVSDAILLFYLRATPSGVESIAYNFKLPILATRVGHFPETVNHGYNGYLAEPDDTDSMAAAMERLIKFPIPPENVAETAKNFSWDNYARVILNKFFIQ